MGTIAADPVLRPVVQDHLDHGWRPEQIMQAVHGLPRPTRMRVTHETIYQALYVQGRGELRRELTRALRTGSTVMISERPAEAADRAVPGHWESDLILGKDNRSAIGTLVERATRYVMLLHLPTGRAPALVRDAIVDTIGRLPTHLRRSLTWDQDSEMHRHHEFTLAADIPVYFCDPRSPWQPGSNENTNSLLRQYFPKDTDLAVHTSDHLDAVAVELNGRPRKTLGWDTPAERLAALLATN